jgi:hypothetical protein
MLAAWVASRSGSGRRSSRRMRRPTSSGVAPHVRQRVRNSAGYRDRDSGDQCTGADRSLRSPDNKPAVGP